MGFQLWGSSSISHVIECAETRESTLWNHANGSTPHRLQEAMKLRRNVLRSDLNDRRPPAAVSGARPRVVPPQCSRPERILSGFCPECFHEQVDARQILHLKAEWSV